MIKKSITHFSCLGLLLASCSGGGDDNPFNSQHHDVADPAQGLSRDDYRHMSEPRPDKKPDENAPKDTSLEGTVAPPIPDLSEILAAPRPPKIGETQLVSIAVTDDVPLKDVLIELSRLADVDIELDAGINGGISFTAKEKPFNQVIERIADLAGLRYSMKNGVLRVERDTPYIISYPIDSLNLDRDSTSTVNISTNVLSGSGGGGGSSGGSSGGGGGGLNTGSNTSISSEAKSDFWKALETGVQVVLNYTPPNRAAQMQTFIAPAAAPTDPASTTSSSSSAAGQAVAAADAQNAAAATPAPAPAPAPAAAASGSESAAGATGLINPNTYYIMNRQAGTITVSATQKQHELLKTFLTKLQANASAQVLIEAKIVEVSLDDRYQSGIDWTAVRVNAGNGASLSAGSNYGSLDATSFSNVTGSKIAQIFGLDLDIDAAVNLVEQFGTTRTLSSPRLNAINNQQAVLTFAKNDVYFTVEIEREEQENDSGNNTTTYNITSTPNTVPLGIILAVQPSINLDNNEVTLNVRPTLSRKLDEVADPGVALAAAQAGLNVQSNIPVIEVRELDSILKLKSGQVMVIGGLMEQANETTETGTPGLSGVPWLGNLFKSKDRRDTNRELIIFIKATIIGNDGYYHNTDRTVYEKFGRDPRPIAF